MRVNPDGTSAVVSSLPLRERCVRLHEIHERRAIVRRLATAN
jgi:hypothetical protein